MTPFLQLVQHHGQQTHRGSPVAVSQSVNWSQCKCITVSSFFLFANLILQNLATVLQKSTMTSSCSTNNLILMRSIICVDQCMCLCAEDFHCCPKTMKPNCFTGHMLLNCHQYDALFMCFLCNCNSLHLQLCLSRMEFICIKKLNDTKVWSWIWMCRFCLVGQHLYV